ncbi:hypothetical protein [Chlorobium phaeobacteroides]|uniref:DUF4296 domain-containing protein n=1 Tax=Chlorobium phaeobacteroides (strain DSM 266 / SMG 266 / 2430) TaxID=290317 RepID=A1BF54_CHLPD|nr:hypothetical protein [Chlorobium phaeobacteroides]ABL65031.1 conserved hypothetical protein [Chlorobium phaeobacteroides DSM 266]
MKTHGIIPGLILLCALLSSGCQKDNDSVLEPVDIRFAAFYTDYLMTSRVDGRVEGADLVPPDAKVLGALIVSHSITSDELNGRIRFYKEHPLRWRSVLLEVRENIRKKRL